MNGRFAGQKGFGLPTPLRAATPRGGCHCDVRRRRVGCVRRPALQLQSDHCRRGLHVRRQAQVGSQGNLQTPVVRHPLVAVAVSNAIETLGEIEEELNGICRMIPQSVRP